MIDFETELLSLEKKTKKNYSSRDFMRICSIRRTFHISVVAIPVAILLFYGIEDKNAWFFGHDYINDYRYRIENNVVYHISVMVSHYALIVTLSVVGILISWIIYELVKLSNITINRSEFRAIFQFVRKTFAFWLNLLKAAPQKPKEFLQFLLNSTVFIYFF